MFVTINLVSIIHTNLLVFPAISLENLWQTHNLSST